MFQNRWNHVYKDLSGGGRGDKFKEVKEVVHGRSQSKRELVARG